MGHFRASHSSVPWLVSVSILLLVHSRSVAALKLSSLLPYGAAAGDTTLPPSDDLSTGTPLPSTMSFFNGTADQLFVSINGHVTLDSGSTEFEPVPFPSAQRTIAMFFTDIYTLGDDGGYVHYRTLNNSDGPKLATLKSDIQRTFPGVPEAQSFEPTAAFVLSYIKVKAYFGQRQLYNTFQMWLAWSLNTTYLCYLYPKDGLQWIRPASTQSYPRAGFDAADGVNYYNHPLSGNPLIYLLPLSSNVGIPGKWCYQISTGSALPAPLVNLALNKPAMQVSTFLTGLASLAVDGNTTGSFVTGVSFPCTYTTPRTYPWWSVDLGADYSVYYVALYNRLTFQERLNGTVVYVGNSSRSWNDVGNTRCDTPPFIYSPSNRGRPYRVGCGLIGRYVWVVARTNSRRSLTLCEVQVMGESTPVNPLQPPPPPAP